MIDKVEIVNLAEQTILISRNGIEIPISDSGSPIMADGDELIGVVLVFKDQTDERARNKLLLENEEKLAYH